MIKVVITGSTGMVGKGVLLECLESPDIEKVLVINRNTIGLTHPKLIEVLLSDFSQVHEIKDHFDGYDACFHCMGISSVGMREENYAHVTYGMTKALADSMYELNPDSVFNYVSGSGTDSSEKGRTMWARVKGRTENYILNKGFKDAYMFRPGAIIPEKGIKSKTGWYSWIYLVMTPIFPLLKKFSSITTTTKIGVAMIKSVTKGFDLKHLENQDINRLSKV